MKARKVAPGSHPRRRVIASFFVAIWTDSVLATSTKDEKKPARALTRPASKAAASRGPVPSPAGVYLQHPQVQAFIEECAAQHDIDIEWVRKALARARRQPAIEKAVLPPPAGTAKNWAAYRARFVEPVRIEAGLRFWRTHEALIEDVARRTGVDAALIVGVIGVETLYGRHTGSFVVLDALTTLAFDFPDAHPRAAERRTYFRSELSSFLALQHRAGVDPTTPRGSYAGAMGLPQFMPGSIARYAVDGDGDGRIDLTQSVPDVIASVANYFVAHGWKPGLPTHLPVKLDAVSSSDLQTLLAPDILPTFTTAALRSVGAEVDASADGLDTRFALVELQNGAAAPSHVLGTENFYVVTRYNWSSYYALAVIELGEAVQARLRN